MDRKLIIHLSVLVLLACFTFFVWSSKQTSKEEAAEKERQELIEEEEYEDEEWDDIALTKEQDDTADAMMATAIPLFITVIYAGFLVIAYLLPAFVDRMSEEMYGSTQEVEDDPLHDARTAFAQGDYPAAIALYRSVWNEDKDDRFPIVEIAKIQRDNLKNPAVAVETLREALESKEWRENDAAFFMFRIADIYENDLQNHEGCVSILQQVISDLPETRHAANATHKLREMGEL